MDYHLPELFLGFVTFCATTPFEKRVLSKKNFCWTVATRILHDKYHLNNEWMTVLQLSTIAITIIAIILYEYYINRTANPNGFYIRNNKIGAAFFLFLAFFLASCANSLLLYPKETLLHPSEICYCMAIVCLASSTLSRYFLPKVRFLVK